LTHTATDVPWVDFTVHLTTGEPMVCRSSLLNAVEHAKRFLCNGYWRADGEGTVILHRVERVDVHATSEEMRELGDRLRNS
jgi:hypothetical protein